MKPKPGFRSESSLSLEFSCFQQTLDYPGTLFIYCLYIYAHTHIHFIYTFYSIKQTWARKGALDLCI